jgi:acyl-CoA synthetase (AMP-forming)/AMP-acid ligase II/acyl carrier protein
MYQNLVHLLTDRARNHPSDVAFDFNVAGQQVDRLSLQELDLAARSTARRLQERIEPGQRVFLMHPPGLDFIVDLFGCFYAGAIAVPIPPPSIHNSSHFLSKLRVAEPALILTGTAQEATLKKRLARVCKDERESVLALPRDTTSNHDVAPLSGTSCAVLQFTSGSSAEPRGVILTHENILTNLKQVHEAFDFCEQRSESVVLWLPHFHDMGLFGRIQCLWSNCAGHLMSPAEFTARPFRWLELLSKTRATVSGAPTFGYDLCVATVSEEERDSLDLSTWRVAFCGAEPVRHGSLRDFSETFSPSGLASTAMTPCYGLAEATLMVSCSYPGKNYEVIRADPKLLERGEIAGSDHEQARTLVSCGIVGNGLDVEIVDPERGVILPDNRIGEIWLSGKNISHGYWGLDHASTTDQFEATLPGLSDSRHFLRSGDLGFLRNGELYVTGRSKALIIVNGRNIQAEDIEDSVRSAHPKLRRMRIAVFGVELDVGERPVVIYEVSQSVRDDKSLLDQTLEAVRTRLIRDFEVKPNRVVAIRKGSLLLTTSGKVARDACRKALEEDAFEILGEYKWSPCVSSETDPTTAMLTNLVGEILRSRDIDPLKSLRDLGGDSLMATRLIARVRDVYDVELEGTLTPDVTVKGLAVIIEQLLIEKVEAMTEEAAIGLLNALDSFSRN